MTYSLIHQLGCGEPAINLICKPAREDHVHYGIMRHLDGRQVNPYDEMICDSCGEPLTQNDFSLTYIKWEEDDA